MTINVIIPARKDSKGLPGKNTKLLCGKPLIDYSIETALEIFDKESIIISSDSEAIISNAKEKGLKTILRPKDLATDNSPIIDTLIHTIRFSEENFGIKIINVLLLQPTFPIRDSNELRKAINIFVDKKLSSLVSVTEMREHPSECVNIPEEESKKWHFLIDPNNITNRQNYLGNYFFVNGNFYISTAESLLKKKTFFYESTNFFKCKDIYLADIDNIQDFEYAEYLLSKKLKK